ncbi:replication factor C subunit 1 [Nematocida sp. AWRm77]|nr:replication factor C subunit 1 [Nematocida sp. AWRm77]
MKRQEEALPFTGRTFVVTGVTKIPREDIVGRIRELGGKATLSVSNSTAYMVVGTEPGVSKMKKARAAGTRILTEDEFVEMTKDYVVQPVEIKKTKLSVSNSTEKWIDKYKPKALADIVGNKGPVAELKKCMDSLENSPLLLCGPSGVGKTLSVYLAAQEAGAALVEYNSTECRNKAEISAIKAQSVQKTLCKGKDLTVCGKKVILLEEVDSMGVSDRGGLQEILSLVKSSRVPVIMTANDKTNPKIKSLLGQCHVVVYHKIDNRTMANYFKKIVEKEGVPVPENTLAQLAIVSGGDLRYGINMLQYICRKKEISKEDLKALSKHDTSPSLFDTTKLLFSPGLSVAKKYSAYYEDPTLALQMVFENYVEGSIHTVADISDSLSRADTIERAMLYEGRKEMFPLGGYFTAIHPPLRLMSRINFSKYLGFSSSRKAKQQKYRMLCQHLGHGKYAGGWSSIYYLPVISSVLQSKLPASTKSKYANDLYLDKSDLSTVSEILKTTIQTKSLTLSRNWAKEKDA